MRELWYISDESQLCVRKRKKETLKCPQSLSGDFCVALYSFHSAQRSLSHRTLRPKFHRYSMFMSTLWRETFRVSHPCAPTPRSSQRPILKGRKSNSVG